MSNEKNTSYEEPTYSISASGESAQSKNPYPAAEVIPLGCEDFTDNSEHYSEKSEDSSVEYIWLVRGYISQSAYPKGRQAHRHSKPFPKVQTSLLPPQVA